MSVERASVFEAQRARLQKLAYRMLGSVAEAEDVVQDAWLRWSRSAADEITEPAAWLVRVTTRLCIDRLRAAKAERQAYRGPWLPEPLIEPLLATGLFEDTGRRTPTGYAVSPTWRIKNPQFVPPRRGR